jgi:hypothetical protein
LYTSYVHANTYSLINKTPKDISVCLKYVACSQDCWETLKPGEQRDFHAGGCCLKTIDADIQDKFGKKLESRVSPDFLCGDATWEVTYNADKNTLTFNQTAKKDIINQVDDFFESIPDFVADRFKNTQATRAIDFAARMAAYETALQSATGILTTAKELAQGTLITARETAKAGTTAANGFLQGVEQTASGVLQVSDDAAKGVLEGVKQTSVGVLQGGTWVVNQTLGQFDITGIHYQGSLQDLSKGVLGNVQVDAKIVTPIHLSMTLDPKNVANSIAGVTNNILNTLKHTFIDPLTPQLAKVKENESKIKGAAQKLEALKPPAEIEKTIKAAKGVEEKMAHLTDQQLKLAEIARGAQKTLQDIQSKNYDQLLQYIDQKMSTNLTTAQKRELRLYRDEIVRKKLEQNAAANT